VFLETIAQIAIGLAGFTGVIVSFATQPERWTAVDRARLYLMLASSIAVLFLALLPLALAALGLQPAMLWRVSSAALLLASVAVVVGFASRLRGLDLRRRREFAPAIYLPLVTGTLANLAVQAANVAGWLAHPDGVFLAGLTWSLFPPALMFGRMVHVLMVAGER
jgi:uncharacterized membrane protein YbhN (UPF0104 family)